MKVNTSLSAILIVFLIIISGCTVNTSHTNDAANTPPSPPPHQQKVEEVIEHDDIIYDVIVAGGEPEGVAAAVSAARNGASTLLVEKRDGLGGLLTYGMLNFIDVNYDKDGKLANHGIFLEFYKQVGGIAFDVKHAKEVFMEMVKAEENITLLLNTHFKAPIMASDGITIRGIEVRKNGKTHRYYGKRVIDATQDADVAAAAGVPYTTGMEDIGMPGRFMAATLMIHLKNVDWDKVQEVARSRKFGYSKANEVAAWGFGKIARMYKPKDKTTRLRGLNIGRQKDGSVLINALQIFGVNGLDEASIEDGLKRGRKETRHVVEFLRKNFPGFEEAEIANYPPELYIRETRHIIGEYQLTINDVLENRDFHDRIGLGSYAVDIQATSLYDYGFVIGEPVQYSLPFRVMVPLKVENLLVVGRSASYTSLAAGSARVIPIGMTLGQAAGVAAKYSIDNNISFRDIPWNEKALKEVQETLLDQGAKFYPFQIENPNTRHWSYPYVRVLLRWGLVNGGYSNDFNFENSMQEKTFVNILVNGIKRSSPETFEIERFRQLYNMSDNSTLTKEEAASLIAKIYGISPEDGSYYSTLLKKGLINREFSQRLKGKNTVTRGEAFCLAAHIITHHREFHERFCLSK